MKQWVTEDQFNEISDEQKDIWYKWIRDHHYTFKEIYVYSGKQFEESLALNFPSIGEMIEFLYEHRDDKRSKSISLPGSLPYEGDIEPEKICDALWEATKEILKMTP